MKTTIGIPILVTLLRLLTHGFSHTPLGNPPESVEGNEIVQVFFVMLCFPVVMNALQYYIIDSFIKEQKPPDHDLIPGGDGDGDSIDQHDPNSRRRARGGDQDDAHATVAGEGNTKEDTAIKVSEGKGKLKLRVEPKKLDEYDPAVDGEGSGSNGEPESPPSSSTESKAKVQSGR